MSGKKAFRIGIRREDKTETERRTPLIPDHLQELREECGIEFQVETSSSRVFKEDEYSNAGAEIVEELRDVDFILGIKEIPLPRLHPGLPHLFFSHVIKGQSYNMPLLQKVLDDNVTLIDYEVITDTNGRRLIAFGIQAGQAGMINSLWSYGQRLKSKGIVTPFTDLRQAREYNSLAEIETKLREIRDIIELEGLPENTGPMIVGVTGHGRVSQGAIQILNILNPIEITPGQLAEEHRSGRMTNNAVYKVVFNPWDIYWPKNGNPFIFRHPVDIRNLDYEPAHNLFDLFTNPDNYNAFFAPYLKHLSVLVNGLFWNPGYPKIVTKELIRTLYRRDPDPKLQVIGDVSCDVDGGIETTIRATLPDNPVYVYHPESGETTDGFEGDGLLMMTVDILPAELPRESSISFSNLLKMFLPRIMEASFDKPLDELGLPDEFQRAVIAHQGKLAPSFEYLVEYLTGEKEAELQVQPEAMQVKKDQRPGSFLEMAAPNIHDYLEELLPDREQVLLDMEKRADDEGFPIVGPQVGQLLQQMAAMVNAEQVFELGSGFGYSAIWFLKGMDEGRVTLTDADAQNRDDALEALSILGLKDRAEFKVGGSIELLRQETRQYDIIYCDIDKQDYPEVIDLAYERLRPGGLLITDNTLWYGLVLVENPEKTAKGVQEYNRALAAHPGFLTVTLPIRDGVSVSMKRK